MQAYCSHHTAPGCRAETPSNRLSSRSSQYSSRALSSLRQGCMTETCRDRRPAPKIHALVNIDFNPSLLLGMGLVGGGLTITSLRSVKPMVSRDLDIVIACVAWMSGGILIFQGWRLDPILFFANTLIAGAAITFSIETFQLRAKVAELEKSDAGWGADKRVRQQPAADPRNRKAAASTLPPPKQQPWDWLTQPLDSRQAAPLRQVQDQQEYAEPSGQSDYFPPASPQSASSSWRGSQQGVSTSKPSSSPDAEDDEGGDGYFQPQPRSRWQESRNQNTGAQTPQQGLQRKPAAQSLPWASDQGPGAGKSPSDGSKRGLFQPRSSSFGSTLRDAQRDTRRDVQDADLPRTSSRSSSRGTSQQDAGSRNDWEEEDGYFQPEPKSSRGSRQSSEQRGRSQPQRSGWQPSAEDWD